MIKRKYWKQALDSQSACNLSGIVFAFSEAMQAICDEAYESGKGTDWKNSHPIAVLFATQIGYLTDICNTDTWQAAYKAAKKAIEDYDLLDLMVESEQSEKAEEDVEEAALEQLRFDII